MNTTAFAFVFNILDWTIEFVAANNREVIK
jgi:hypothetical protein